jgi:hypothetical protein
MKVLPFLLELAKALLAVSPSVSLQLFTAASMM